MSKFLFLVSWLLLGLIAFRFVPVRSEIRELTSLFSGWYLVAIIVCYSLQVFVFKERRLLSFLIFILTLILGLLPIASLSVVKDKRHPLNIHMANVTSWNTPICQAQDAICISSTAKEVPPAGFQILESAGLQVLLPIKGSEILVQNLGIESTPGFLVALKRGEREILLGAIVEGDNKSFQNRRNSVRRLVSLLREERKDLPTVIITKTLGSLTSFVPSILVGYGHIRPRNFFTSCFFGPYCNTIFERGVNLEVTEQ